MVLDLSRPSFGLVVTTQVFLGLLSFAGLAAIALLPDVSTNLAKSLPEYAELRGPLLAVTSAFTILGLIEFAMVALLVHRIYTGTILNRASLLWVNVIVVVLACAILLDFVGFIAINNAQAGSPFIGLAQIMAFLTLAALACITLVLRSLLRSAIVMRTELDEVV